MSAFLLSVSREVQGGCMVQMLTCVIRGSPVNQSSGMRVAPCRR